MSSVVALITKYEKLADYWFDTMCTCPRFDHQVYDMAYAKHELCLKVVEDLELLHNDVDWYEPK